MWCELRLTNIEGFTIYTDESKITEEVGAKI